MQRFNSLLVSTSKLFFILLISTVLEPLKAQNEILFMNDEKIKQENGLFGIKLKKDWTVPAKYDKIEGYGGYTRVKDKTYTSTGGYLICYKGDLIDLYNAAYPQESVATDLTLGQWELLQNFGITSKLSLLKDKKWSNAIDEFTPAQKEVARKFVGGRAYIKNGKWGFTSNEYSYPPTYDSLFSLCLVFKDGRVDPLKCGEVIGFSLNGSKGVMRINGEIIAQHKDYIRFQYQLLYDRYEIVCTHKSGVEVVYHATNDRMNNYIETKNKEGLYGYVLNGEFIEPKYKEIKKSYLPGTDYECILPNASVEYRKGAQIVSADEVAKGKEKVASNEMRTQEEAKKKEENASKEKANALRKKEDLDKMITMKEDSIVGRMMELYDKQTPLLNNKINAMDGSMKLSMLQNTNGEFNRGQWPTQTLDLRNELVKPAKKQLETFKNELMQFEYTEGKFDFYMAIKGYLKETDDFVKLTESWADLISDVSVEGSVVRSKINTIDQSRMEMKMGEKFCIGLVTEYRNSKKTTGKYLTTMKAAKGEKEDKTEMDPFEIVKIVRSGTSKELLDYCKKFKLEFISTQKEGDTDYKTKEPFIYGVESFLDVKKERLIVTFVFKDSDQKKKYQAMWAKEGFTVKKQNEASYELTNNGVDIWFIPGTLKWQISKSNP